MAERPPCVCGCDCLAGKKKGSIFKQGHDGKLRGFIKRGAPELARVNWHAVPLDFHKNQFRAEITRFRRSKPRR